MFQCKHYQGVVSAAAIRDFRGAMVGREDKGLSMTTGTFSKAAIKEATRDRTPPIDLIDGNALAEILKEYALGVTVKMVEEISVNEGWFNTIRHRLSGLRSLRALCSKSVSIRIHPWLTAFVHLWFHIIKARNWAGNCPVTGLNGCVK